MLVPPGVDYISRGASFSANNAGPAWQSSGRLASRAVLHSESAALAPFAGSQFLDRSGS